MVSAKLYQSPELVIQAETRLSESPFVLECLEWHNYFRKKHLAPELILDPLVNVREVHHGLLTFQNALKCEQHSPSGKKSS